ncbi:hypothetical protein VF21_07369 [Pseudogymnoascus sp. 05NY08]|nr:hypothetical protein VF21_07369 [Pseudogymnoascus sp. 05NY08]
MAITKSNPRTPPSIPLRTLRTPSRNIPTYGHPLLDLPFVIIDYLIILTTELNELFTISLSCLWNCTLAYSMFIAAQMCWFYNQDDCLNLVYAVRKMLDVMGNFCTARG